MKNCENCGATMVREASVSGRVFAARRFCGTECSTAHARSNNSPSAAECSSANLNQRMWAVYERIATERGLSHPLVAAYQLWMRP